MKPFFTPLGFLRVMEEYATPETWRFEDELRRSRGKDLPSWPDEVFLPFAGWYAVTCDRLRVSSLSLVDISLMQGLATIGTWRWTKDIVRFDQDVMDSLLQSPLSGAIPADVLWRLPAWCVYVDVPLTVMGHETAGFWALLEQDVHTGERELRMSFLCRSALLPLILHVGDWTLEEAVDRCIDESIRQACGVDMTERIVEMEATRAAMKRDVGLRQAVSLLLYVCVYGLQDTMTPQDGGQVKIERPRHQKTAQGWRMVPAKKTHEHVLGKAFGEQIRAWRAVHADHADHVDDDHQRRGPSPHIRRAHWHGYWTGRKVWHEGEEAVPQKLIVRWIPPIQVGMSEEQS